MSLTPGRVRQIQLHFRSQWDFQEPSRKCLPKLTTLSVL